jgi:hypothetical protein
MSILSKALFSCVGLFAYGETWVRNVCISVYLTKNPVGVEAPDKDDDGYENEGSDV